VVFVDLVEFDLESVEPDAGYRDEAELAPPALLGPETVRARSLKAVEMGGISVYCVLTSSCLRAVGSAELDVRGLRTPPSCWLVRRGSMSSARGSGLTLTSRQDRSGGPGAGCDGTVPARCLVVMLAGVGSAVRGRRGEDECRFSVPNEGRLPVNPARWSPT
jgi:hypothetical protein